MAKGKLVSIVAGVAVVAGIGWTWGCITDRMDANEEARVVLAEVPALVAKAAESSGDAFLGRLTVDDFFARRENYFKIYASIEPTPEMTERGIVSARVRCTFGKEPFMADFSAKIEVGEHVFAYDRWPEALPVSDVGKVCDPLRFVFLASGVDR